MKRWKICILLLALCLCACGRKEPAPPPAEVPAPEAGDGRTACGWEDLAWEDHLELEYAQSFSVDFSEGGYARIRIDQETYLLCPEGMEPPADTPEEIVVLRQPLENIYMQATAAMDSFCQLDALDAVPSPAPGRRDGTSRRPGRRWRRDGWSTRENTTRRTMS